MSGLFLGHLGDSIDKAEQRVLKQDLRTRASVAAFKVQADGKRLAFQEKWAGKAAIGAGVFGVAAAGLTTWALMRKKAAPSYASAPEHHDKPKRKGFPAQPSTR
jgi:hypothetical protein